MKTMMAKSSSARATLRSYRRTENTKSRGRAQTCPPSGSPCSGLSPEPSIPVCLTRKSPNVPGSLSGQNEILPCSGRGSGSSCSSSICRMSRSMPRDIDVMGTSCASPSKGFFDQSPMRSALRNTQLGGRQRGWGCCPAHLAALHSRRARGPRVRSGLTSAATR